MRPRARPRQGLPTRTAAAAAERSRPGSPSAPLATQKWVVPVPRDRWSEPERRRRGGKACLRQLHSRQAASALATGPGAWEVGPAKGGASSPRGASEAQRLPAMAGGGSSGGLSGRSSFELQAEATTRRQPAGTRAASAGKTRPLRTAGAGSSIRAHAVLAAVEGTDRRRSASTTAALRAAPGQWLLRRSAPSGPFPTKARPKCWPSSAWMRPEPCASTRAPWSHKHPGLRARFRGPPSPQRATLHPPPSSSP